MSAPILVARSDSGITRLTLNDPDRRNALSLELRSDLLAALRAEAAAPETRVLVITGAGAGFCAGGDISAMGQDPVRADARLAILHGIARAMAAFPKPVVAAVNGAAFGAGMSIALMADHVVAAPRARLGASFTRMGLVPDTGFLWAIQRRTTPARALRMVLSAEVLTAEGALAEGLVDEIAEDVLTAAEDRARGYLSVAPLAFAAAKSALASTDGLLEAYLAREANDQARMFRSADHLEAVAAFREKRDPSFRGA